jgi:putative DeoR family transcriptional regulator (stage III sporulation protein D)
MKNLKIKIGIFKIEIFKIIIEIITLIVLINYQIENVYYSYIIEDGRGTIGFVLFLMLIICMDILNGRERAEVIAKYVIETGDTVRGAAAHFGISKSTIHKDLAYKLKYYNTSLYKSVKEILEINKSERHLRGGEATRMKYLIKAGKN